MAFDQRRNPWQAEMQKIKKQEDKLLEKRADKKDSYLNRLLADKVPDKLQGTLDAAFAKAFRLIFEKGTALIEKTYNKDEREKKYLINEYSAEVRKTRKSARSFSKNAAGAGMKNMALSGISGIGMGAVG